MDLLNRIMKILTCVVIIIIMWQIFILLFEPLMYGPQSNGRLENNTQKVVDIFLCVEKYLDGYYNKDIEFLKKSNTMYIRQDDEVYQNICTKINSEYNELVLNKVEKAFNNVYIIEYSINTDFNEHILDEPQINKMIIKLKNNKMKVYYDSLLNDLD